MSAAPRVLRSDPAGDAQPSTCTDCGGRGWRRQMGATACACLVRDVRAQTAAHHGLVDRLTVRLAEIEERLAALEARR